MGESEKQISDNQEDIRPEQDNEATEQEKDKKKLVIFKPNDLLGGYSLAVRDNWGFKILRRHITEEEKKLFEKKFGEINHW